MKIIIEGSTLSTKGFTGIPHYIISIQKALKNKHNIEVELAFNLKKINKFKPEVLKKTHFWYVGSILFSRTFKPAISHSLHTPFLKLNGTKKIATIHDLAVHLPEFAEFNFASKYFQEKRYKLFQDFAKNADAIIAVSQATKDDYLKMFDYPEEKIHVVHLAPVFKPLVTKLDNENDILNSFSIGKENYFLSVGGVSKRKNSFNLIKGFALSGERKTTKLVFAGKIVESEMEIIKVFLKEHDLENDVVFTSYISDETLSVLYKNAKAFLFPTYYEGFGIPIIEAMAYGLPVLTGNIGAAPEVANGYALLVDPHNPEEIARGIVDLGNIEKDKVKLAKEYAKGFTWDKVAEETIKVYNSVL
ncbi:glycosyltransferase family 4 protein [Algibacter lectus]|uniref:Glycosyltransferase n=1 Tax=Algibacter lectus TaxID=221126 RepID=A0A090VG03_9FLAO|nr:glycosyltransferase family 1 protein [Algibacter lectus]MDO7138707.1 glycosyltransferase family 1 protein [Algibacter lectus]GAL62958.1 glycosyltransferase [Algibacter lectus]